MFTTTHTSYSLLPNPTANITVNKSRVKNYGTNVYLKDGAQFEIEIFNPRTNPILAKIKINGNYISSAGIILKPGQRVFLERFIDVDKKFKFETYEIEGSSEAQAAASLNGLVQVEFYDEVQISGNIDYTYRPTITYGSTLPSTFTTLTNTGSGTISNMSLTSGLNAVYCSSVASPVSGAVNEKSVETGRVEKGEKSNQKMESSNGNFSTWACHTETIKILPASQKPVEASEIRNYCSDCGTRIKKSSWKFCPSCGANLKD